MLAWSLRPCRPTRWRDARTADARKLAGSFDVPPIFGIVGSTSQQFQENHLVSWSLAID